MAKRGKVDFTKEVNIDLLEIGNIYPKAMVESKSLLVDARTLKVINKHPKVKQTARKSTKNKYRLNQPTPLQSSSCDSSSKPKNLLKPALNRESMGQGLLNKPEVFATKNVEQKQTEKTNSCQNEGNISTITKTTKRICSTAGVPTPTKLPPAIKAPPIAPPPTKNHSST
uniref:Pollen-specific leucine-rich repeat extensin-like protein 1 n=2 Tax=Ciona intestinalis TaxID=7719 RepID=F6SHW3_CIOIN